MGKEISWSWIFEESSKIPNSINRSHPICPVREFLFNSLLHRPSNTLLSSATAPIRKSPIALHSMMFKVITILFVVMALYCGHTQAVGAPSSLIRNEAVKMCGCEFIPYGQAFPEDSCTGPCQKLAVETDTGKSGFTCCQAPQKKANRKTIDYRNTELAVTDPLVPTNKDRMNGVSRNTGCVLVQRQVCVTVIVNGYHVCIRIEVIEVWVCPSPNYWAKQLSLYGNHENSTVVQLYLNFFPKRSLDDVDESYPFKRTPSSGLNWPTVQ